MTSLLSNFGMIFEQGMFPLHPCRERFCPKKNPKFISNCATVWSIWVQWCWLCNKAEKLYDMIMYNWWSKELVSKFPEFACLLDMDIVQLIKFLIIIPINWLTQTRERHIAIPGPQGCFKVDIILCIQCTWYKNNPPLTWKMDVLNNALVQAKNTNKEWINTATMTLSNYCNRTCDWNEVRDHPSQEEFNINLPYSWYFFELSLSSSDEVLLSYKIFEMESRRIGLFNTMQWVRRNEKARIKHSRFWAH